MAQFRFAVTISFVFYAACAFAQIDKDETQAISIANRFLSILEKNPQRGTALEKVFSHHLQRGNLDSFVDELKRRTTADSQDGGAWMLLGLIESQRRMDTEAIVAFTEAEKLRPNDVLPAYYRGQSLLRIGEPTQAIQAFEIAIQRKPNRIVLLEIFEQLGRTHQRLNQNDLAIEVWKRLESRFPGDIRVLEQIASILNQEGAYAEALPRYQQLIVAVKDAYQRTHFRIEAAQIQIRLGAKAKGMVELESILGDLKPDGWLYRDVQRKIEDVFLKSSDQAGLVSYYENKLGKSPDDIESMVRLCKFLVPSGRIEEANRWMLKAIERAPTRIDLRKTLIDQLIADRQLTAAAEQFSQLALLDPKNQDVLRDWGKTVLRDPALSIDEAKSRASAIWKKSLEHRTDDALAHIQVADLHMSAHIPDVARQLFKRATELAPEEAQYHEYFGEFLFQNDQREEAFAEWNSIADGLRRNANSVMRLAEIYDHAKQSKQAADFAAQACTLAPQDSSMYVRAARLQRKANQIDGAMESLVAAESFADSEDQREFILLERMAILEASNRLKPAIQVLQTQLRQEKNPSVAQWVLLSRYFVYQKRWKEANAAMSEVLKLDEHNPKMLVLSSDIAEGLGNVEQSIQSLRKLADLDRRKRQDYLERIVKLHVRKKKWPEAVEAAREVVQAAPSRLESYEFFAQVCMQAKKPEQAIEALRKAMRIDPDSSRLTLALGSALAENRKYDEAIELYWQAFAKAQTLEDKVDLTLKLAKLHEKQHRLNNSSNGVANANSQLIDRLEAGRKDPAQRRDLTVCLSELYLSVSDFENAKRNLEDLLSDRSRDTSILQKLARICVAADDIEMAIDYQRQLVAIVPGNENESYLAILLRQQGDWFEADEIVARLLQRETDAKAALQSINGLLRRGDFELVLKTLEPMLRKEPENWELLFRLGLAHAGADQWPQAIAAFERLLALDVEQSRKTQLSDADTLKLIESPILSDIALGRENFTADAIQVGTEKKGAPEGFGAMRIASIAWLVCCENNSSACKSDWIAQVNTQAESDPSRFQLMDALTIAKFRQDAHRQVSFGAELASRGDPELQAYFLELLRRRYVSGNAEENDNMKPLSRSQIDLMLEANTETTEDAFALPVRNRPSTSSTAALISRMQLLANSSPQGTFTANISGQTITFANGIARVNISVPQTGMTFSTLSSRMPAVTVTLQNEGFVRTVVSELRFAGQPERAESFLAHQIETADSEFQLASLCEYLLISQRFVEIERPLIRWFELQHPQLEDAVASANSPVLGIPTKPTLRSPAELMVELMEGWGAQAPKTSWLSLLDANLASSNRLFLRSSLPPLNAWSLSPNTNRLIGIQAPFNQNRSSPQLWCKSFVSEQEQQLLSTSKPAFDGVDPASGLTAYLQRRVDQSEPEVRPLEQLRLGLFSEQNDGRINSPITIEAMKQIGLRREVALHAAAALLDHSDYTASFELAESIQPENAQDSLIRRLILFHAATSMNDKVKAEAAFKEIENERLDLMTQQSLTVAGQKAIKMGIANANKLLRQGNAAPTSVQTQRQPVKSAEALRAQQMIDFEKKGKSVEAIRLAKQFVSKPRTYASTLAINGSLGPSPRYLPSQNNISAQNAANFARSQAQRASGGRSAIVVDEASSFRASAWRILKKSSELENLIVETEQRLVSSPNSFSLLELLVEYYEVAGKLDLAEKTIIQALQVRPSASQLRIHFATGLAKADKSSQACEQFLELIRFDLKNALPVLPQVASWFELRSSSSELRDAILLSNFRLVPSPERYLSIGKQLLDSKNGFEIGAAILERLVEADANLTRQTLQIVYGSGIAPYPRLMSFSKEALIPDENEATRDPWFGLRDAPFLRTGDTLFEMLLACHSKEEVVEKLEPFIQKAVDRMPRWLAGRMMLALIAAKTDRPTVAKEHFASLANAQRLQIGIPEEIAERLAIEFMQFPEARATAIALTEGLLATNKFVNFNSERRPVILLAKLLVADGQRAKAIEILTREYENKSGGYQGFVNSTAGRSEPVKIPMLADQLLTIGLPVESYQLFDSVTSIERSRQAFLMVQQKGLITSREKGMRAAIQLLESLPAEKAIHELLQDRSNTAKNLPALEVMFQVPLAKDVSTQSMESAMQQTLIRHARAGMLSDMEQRLEKFVAMHPADVSILATQALLRLTTGEGDAEAALRDLESALLKQEKSIANLLAFDVSADLPFENRKQVEMVMATWLVARKCYEAKQYMEMADRLADQAFKCAKFLDGYNQASQDRNPRVDKNASDQPLNETVREPEFANILLLEWGRVRLRAGRTETGLAKWKELVDAIRVVSTKNPPVVNGPIDVRPNQTWSQDQIEWLIRLANLSIDCGQAPFAKQIAKVIVKCQLPEDYTAIQKTTASRLYYVTKDATQAVHLFNALLQRFENDDSMPMLRFELLLPILLPGDRRVCLFPEVSDLLNLLREQPHCIAGKLIESAVLSNRIDDLKSALENREPSLNQIVMLTQIAIAEKDNTKANRLLMEIDRQLSLTKLTEALTSACQVAIPAFQVVELREMTLPILDKLFSEVKRSNKMGEADFKLLPLVKDVDEYLRDRNRLPK